MFAGHIGAALAIARAERRINVGVFVFAGLLLDVALWVFVLLGWESVVIPTNFSATRQPEFAFPLSHGFAAGVAWSAVAAIAAFMACAKLGALRARAAMLVFAAVFSHWLLDALVHRPELPVVGAGSAMIGLGLWQNMAVALVLEGLVLAAGIAVFLAGAALPATRKIWLIALSMLVLLFTVVGMTVAPPPPSATAMASSSLATIAIVCALVYWLARHRGERPT